MSSTDPAHPGIADVDVGYLPWTMHGLDSQVVGHPLDFIAVESMKLEAALTSEDIQIKDKFKKTVLCQFQAKTEILEAQLMQV